MTLAPPRDLLVGRSSGPTLFAVSVIGGVAVGWIIGFVVTQDLSPFRLALLVLAIGSVPLPLLHFQLCAPLFLGVLWTRVSDVAITSHGFPSIATPAAGLILAVSFIRRIAAGEQIRLSTFRDLYPALPYTAVVLLSALWSAYPLRALNSGVIVLKDVVIFWMLADGLRNFGALKMAAKVLVIAAGSLSVPSLHQYFTGEFINNYGGFAQSEILNIVGDFEGYRLGGPFNSPNYFALVLLVTIPVGLALLRTHLGILERLLIAGFLPVVSLTVLLTYSRGGTLLLVGLVLLSLPRHRLGFTHAVLGAAVLTAMVAVTPPRVWDRLETLTGPLTGRAESGSVVDESVDLRIGAQRTAIEMFLSSPFLGVGAGNFPPLYQDYARWLGLRSRAAEYTPHNLYLEILAETGIIGLLTYAGMALLPVIMLRRARGRIPGVGQAAHDHRELTYGFELAFLGYLLAGFFEQGAFPRYFWMLLALVVASAHVQPWAEGDERADGRPPAAAASA